MKRIVFTLLAVVTFTAISLQAASELENRVASLEQKVNQFIAQMQVNTQKVNKLATDIMERLANKPEYLGDNQTTEQTVNQ